MANRSAAFALDDSDSANEPQTMLPSHDETRATYVGRARIRDVESKLGVLSVDNRLKIDSEGLTCNRCDSKTHPAPCGEQ